jgi:predicted SAM-dependent methyltransferase
MLQQDLKDIYFLAAKWLSYPNHLFNRLRYSKEGAKPLLLHLGCGDTYIPGMINIDGNIRRKKELWLDLRNGLPFGSQSVSCVYCSHTIEHFYPNDAIKLLKEIHRVLKPNHCARIAVPSFEHAMDVMSQKCKSEWPQRFESGPSQAVNYLFCDGQHKYGYTSEIMTKFATAAGFKTIRDISQSEGVKPKEYFGILLGDEPEGSLVFELYA